MTTAGPRAWRRWAAAVAAVWMLALVGLSLQDERPSAFSRRAYHREMHWLLFGATAALLCLLTRTRRQKLVVAASLCLTGLGIELLQHAVYATRRMDWRDVSDDSLAVIGVCLLAILLSGRRSESEYDVKRP